MNNMSNADSKATMIAFVKQVRPTVFRDGEPIQPDLWAFGGVERLPNERRENRRGGRCLLLL
jgi:hypothetical protein